ncbi:MAG TPA: hypothetical protein VD838_21525 [Anaeromyxobacteraceae bacterium]|nr:hypothetical protein [Anaeromyxobacteraceae bacterium]
MYEGPEVLSALLRSAGSPHDADEVAALFSRAQADGEDRSSVIPALFPDEPRFASPDAARRLYGNLFGLWARLAAGLGVADDAPAAAEPGADRSSVLRQAQDERTLSPESGSAPLRSPGSASAPLPERGLAPGDEVPAEVIEAVWKHLAAAPGAELSRLRDRFSNAQPDLAAWLDSVELPEAGAAAALDLAFEAWVMFDRAFGDRLRHVEYRDLRALEAGPPALDEHQPAFAAYVGEQLDLLTDEDPGFDPGAREGVERVAAVVAGALTRAVQLVS